MKTMQKSNISDNKVEVIISSMLEKTNSNLETIISLLESIKKRNKDASK